MSTKAPLGLYLAFLSALLSVLPASAQEVSNIKSVAEPPVSAVSGPNGTSKEIQILDATPVYLRFAQPVVGVPQEKSYVLEHARKGDVVRLVVAADVRINGVLLFSKGSLAQATVMKAARPAYKTTCPLCPAMEDSGLELRFDWVKSVDGEEVSLRHKRRGKKSNKFPVLLSSRNGSHLLTEFSLEHRGFREGLDMSVKAQTRRQWTVIPTGTRVKAYVNGNTTLDAASVTAALALLPQSNATATVTIYRENGSKDKPLHVSCDEKDLGLLADHQYFVVEMDQGKHACRLDPGETLMFSVSSGEQFYLRVHHSSLVGKWEIAVVNPAMGEDSIVDSEPIENPEQKSYDPQ
jgi:hypothetical protein